MSQRNGDILHHEVARWRADCLRRLLTDDLAELVGLLSAECSTRHPETILGELLRFAQVILEGKEEAS